jgi:hypothetical protein
LLAPLQSPKLEDHLLSAVRDWLFNIFAATLDIWRPVREGVLLPGAYSVPKYEYDLYSFVFFIGRDIHLLENVALRFCVLYSLQMQMNFERAQ